VTTSNPLQFPLDKAGYISAVLQHHKRLVGSTDARRADDLRNFAQQQVDFYNQLISITESISQGELSYDRLQFYENGEVRVLMPAPTLDTPKQNRWLASRAKDITASPYHKLPANRENQ
jgi:hypothetical protein